jgi:prephenate dehydratase
MTSLKITYQGEPGANSHIACLNVFPDCSPVPCATFEDALAAVTDGSAALAMIPIENSLAGRVADIHYLLPTTSLYIIGEYFLPIRFQLMAADGASLETLKSVYSHVHALGQCRKIIRQYGLAAHVAGDTAGAAREISEWKDPTKAALATNLAAEIYGLNVLAADVEDETHNATRFVILSKDAQWSALDHDSSGRNPALAPSTITSFIFRVRNVPAALYKALGGFATNGVNMTKLESYMVEGEFIATQFFADVDGHPDQPALARALEELAFYCKEMKIIGVYPAHPYRIENKTAPHANLNQ